MCRNGFKPFPTTYGAMKKDEENEEDVRLPTGRGFFSALLKLKLCPEKRQEVLLFERL